ncbi:hypothetical protein SAMN05660742_12927 [Propionispira arboris]|uniref:Uncharacterized protein n=1 Tax=Propionispira arboris TaxID=84035 RepID=A0A1H7D2P9_9FIRM|nr:hypothetical protein [Propionispira arboris]SEJ96099.1 hypothetical protein SAMN05660742_12927 [Propionispira arboris]
MQKQNSRPIKIVELVESKKDNAGTSRQVNVRFKKDELIKLERIKRETGLSFPSIIQNFVREKDVAVRYDAKSVIRQLTDIHNAFNEYNHYVVGEIDDLKTIFSKVNENIVDSNIGLQLKPLILDAEILTEHLLKKYRKTNEDLNQEMKNIVDIHDGK